MGTLSNAALQGSLVIKALFYAEVSVTFDTAEELDEALPPAYSMREPLPWEAAFIGVNWSFEEVRWPSGIRRKGPSFPSLNDGSPANERVHAPRSHVVDGRNNAYGSLRRPASARPGKPGRERWWPCRRSSELHLSSWRRSESR